MVKDNLLKSFDSKTGINKGQVDSPKSPETPEMAWSIPRNRRKRRKSRKWRKISQKSPNT